jgi:hypothetical protein
MPCNVVLTPTALNKISSGLNAASVQSISDFLGQVEADPEKYVRRGPSPPFPPGTLVCHSRVFLDGRERSLTYFVILDNEQDRVEVYDVTASPALS